jgi:hypothetical protein
VDHHVQELCLMTFSGHVSTQTQHSEHSFTFGQVDFSLTTSNTSEGQMLTHSPHPVHLSSSMSIVNPASALYVFIPIVLPPSVQFIILVDHPSRIGT